MIDERFMFVGVLLNVIGGFSYLIATIKGEAKPNKVTWFLWALAPLIAFAAEIHQGVGLQSLLTFMVGFNPLLVFIASFINKQSQWKLSSIDIICGVLSFCGLLLWYVSKVGNVAIMFSILADGLASIPTVIKSYKAPETESSTIFALGAMSATITLLTIKEWNLAHYAFPLYILFICLTLFTLIQFRLGRKIKVLLLRK